ncbi:MAG: hypothetical protein A2V45_13645 [Candidatus Aminicenantes bacterium RBG_19FT_COMBO_58_17]|nr:MAG: hypothetical protein A2V45_13645 [Candidatus Aminicenantes bacterium RBG_19FT_COMBO_58_17]
MRKVSTGVLMLVFLLAPAVRAGQEAKPDEPPPRHRVLNLSLFYPVSMNRMKQDTANISLSLLYGHLGSVRGLDISLGAAALERSLEGIQLAGLIAAAGEFMTGAQAAGLLSVAGDSGEGVQLAGLGSVGGEEFTGLQVAGLFAVAGERLKGAQFSGLFSVAGESTTGVQASGLFSVAGDKLDGIQIAGLFNVAGEDSRALQVAGLMNVTGGTCRGLQVGLFNVAGKLTGVQVGLVNAVDEIDGLPIGLVNLTRKEDRRIQMAAWAGSVSLLNAGVKIWAKRFYSILYAGAINLPQSVEDCLGYGFQYGYAFPLGASGGSAAGKRIDIDAGYLYLDNSTLFRHLEGTPDRHVLSVRGSLAIELSPQVSLVGGVGLGYRIDYGTSLGDGSLFPLVFAGVELF